MLAGREWAEFDLREYFKAAYETAEATDEKPPIIIQGEMSYVRRTYNWLTRWGIMPRPGGLDNQYLSWVRDMEQMSAVDREVHAEWLEHIEEDKTLNGTAQ